MNKIWSVPATLALVSAIATSGATATIAGASTPEPSGRTGKVVVIGLDGTMLDVIKESNAPRLQRLIADGVSGSSSILGYPTISGPSWSTVLTGVWAPKHGVSGNDIEGSHIAEFPTVFSRVEAARPELATRVFATWDGIATIVGKSLPSADIVKTTPDQLIPAWTDGATAATVADEIAAHGPDVTFAQLDQVDAAGHLAGTLAPTYRAAVEQVDREVGKIVDAVDRRQREHGEDWTILLASDHGHRPFGGHGGQSQSEATTLVIARGPGFPAGRIDNSVSIADIAPTVLDILGTPVPHDLDGNSLR